MLAHPARAQDAPLWEAGIGVAGLHFPDYRGSEQSRNYALPAPYFVYRGDFIKADRGGLRSIFFKTDRLDLNLSAGASLPVDSSENRAREGMPDLRPSVEIGPSLSVNLWRADDRNAKVDLRLPLRAAFTVESRSRFIGGQFFPNLNLDIAHPFGMPGWNLGLLAGPVFTDSRYNRYFYEVRPEYATAARPAFSDTGSGYAGMQFLAAVSKRYPNFWVGGFARYDTLKNAVFEESPLVTSKRYVAFGFGVSWIFKESTVRVKLSDPTEAR